LKRCPGVENCATRPPSNEQFLYVAVDRLIDERPKSGIMSGYSAVSGFGRQAVKIRGKATDIRQYPVFFRGNKLVLCQKDRNVPTMNFGRFPFNVFLVLMLVSFVGCDDTQRKKTDATPIELDPTGSESTPGIAQHEMPANQESRSRATDDTATILGSWRVVEATANGDRYTEGVGTIYTFEANSKVHIVGHDYEAYFDYLVDPSFKPKRLMTFLGKPRGEGIYTLDGDSLRFRECREPQRLSFDAKEAPHGRWNEYLMIRITPSEAQEAIEQLKDERLSIKASNP
jgi:uncharacterized protein (TIGR03067 family)